MIFPSFRDQYFKLFQYVYLLNFVSYAIIILTISLTSFFCKDNALNHFLGCNLSLYHDSQVKNNFQISFQLNCWTRLFLVHVPNSDIPYQLKVI